MIKYLVLAPFRCKVGRKANRYKIGDVILPGQIEPWVKQKGLVKELVTELTGTQTTPDVPAAQISVSVSDQTETVEVEEGILEGGDDSQGTGELEEVAPDLKNLETEEKKTSRTRGSKRSKRDQ